MVGKKCIDAAFGVCVIAGRAGEVPGIERVAPKGTRICAGAGGGAVAGDDTEGGAESGVGERREGGRASSTVTEAENAGKAGEAGERVNGCRTRKEPKKEG